MKSKRDIFYSVGFTLFTIFFTAILCFMTEYYVYNTEVQMYSIFQHIVFSDKEELLSNYLYAAPYVCNGICVNQWFIIFVPMIASTPFLIQFVDEFSGFYRVKLIRTNYNKYWNKIFFKVGFSGSCSATIGYTIFSVIVYCFFPQLSEYGTSKPIVLNSYLNKLFHVQSEFVFWLNRAIVIFTFVFCISQLCLLLFLIFMNRYKAIGFPMIAFYLLDQLSLFLYNQSLRDGKYYIISPKNVLFFTEYTFESWGLSYLWYLIFLVFALILLYLIGKKIFMRRIMN